MFCFLTLSFYVFMSMQSDWNESPKCMKCLPKPNALQASSLNCYRLSHINTLCLMHYRNLGLEFFFAFAKFSQLSYVKQSFSKKKKKILCEIGKMFCMENTVNNQFNFFPFFVYCFRQFFFFFWREFHQPMASISNNSSFIIRPRHQSVNIMWSNSILGLGTPCFIGFMSESDVR